MNQEIQKNVLHYYINLLRNKSFDENSHALYSIIKVMNLSRRSFICGENFDCIDFGNLILNNIYFSDNGKNSSSFRRCKLSEWNIRGGQIGRIFHVEFSDNNKFVITFGNDGRIIVWDIETQLVVETHTAYPAFYLSSYGAESEDYVKPRVMWVKNVLGDLEKSNNMSSIDAPNDRDIEKIKSTILSKYFADSVVHCSDERKNKALHLSECLNNNQFYFDDLTADNIELSNNGDYAIIKAHTKHFLFKISSGEIIESTTENIIMSSNNAYYAIYSANELNVYSLECGEMVFCIKRNVNEIAAVDICARKALSRAVEDSESPSCRRYYIWSLETGVVDCIYDMPSLKTIEKDIESNSELEFRDEADRISKMGYLSRSLDMLNDRKNVSYEATVNDDCDYFLWEMHIAEDHSFYITYDLYEDRCNFVYVSEEREIDEYHFKGEIICAVLSNNDKCFYILTSSNIIYCWDTSKCSFKNEVHLKIPINVYITCAQFSIDSMMLIAGTDTGVIFLINTKNGNVLEIFYHISSLHMLKCDVTDINADNVTKKILRQNGAKMEECFG